MNVGEYGIVYNLNVNFDISGFTSLSLTFTKPDLTTFTVTNPLVSVGTVSIFTSQGIFSPNQYATYKFALGDISLPGTYSARLTYVDASKRLISDANNFVVNT